MKSPGLAFASIALLTGTCLAGSAAGDPPHRTLTVTEDPMTPVLDAFDKLIRDKHLPVVVRAVSLDVSGDAPSPDPEARKRHFVNGWIAEAVTALEGQGLTEVDINTIPGFSKEGIRDQMLAGVPYAFRDQARDNFADVRMAVNPTLVCGPGQGAVMAMVEGAYPTAGDRRAYGSLMLVVMGLGDCATPTRSGDLAQILRQVKANFDRKLEEYE